MDAEGTSMGKFIIKGTKNGGFKFDLVAGNGEVIANSQVYKSLRTLKSGTFKPSASIWSNNGITFLTLSAC